MISLKDRRFPIQQGRIGLGQFTSFLAPMDAEGPAIPPAPVTAPPAAPAVAAPRTGPTKTMAVITGLALTGLSAATAYVGISYGMDKDNTNIQRAVGWTVGVVGVLSGLVRLAGTTILAAVPEAELV